MLFIKAWNNNRCFHFCLRRHRLITDIHLLFYNHPLARRKFQNHLACFAEKLQHRILLLLEVFPPVIVKNNYAPG
jgi:hypothetical protein